MSLRTRLLLPSFVTIFVLVVAMFFLSQEMRAQEDVVLASATRAREAGSRAQALDTLTDEADAVVLAHALGVEGDSEGTLERLEASSRAVAEDLRARIDDPDGDDLFVAYLVAHAHAHDRRARLLAVARSPDAAERLARLASWHLSTGILDWHLDDLRTYAFRRLEVSVSRLEALRVRFMSAMTTLVGIVAALVTFSWYVAQRYVVERLERLALHMTVVGTGPGVRLAEHGRDEISALARAFDDLRDRLGASTVSIERHRKAEEAIRAQAEALGRQAQELERSNRDLEQFSYVASHDLQEPLRKVASFVQMLRMELGEGLSDDARTYMGFAVDGATRMQTLITDLLEFSRVGRNALVKEPVALVTVIARVEEDLAVALENSGGRIALEGESPVVWGDPSELCRLLQNLVSNALKYRREESPLVRIRADCERGDEGRRVHHLRVSDNGLGIEPQYLDRVFEIFKRLHSRERYPGTGIGLAICKKIVERHGGRIWAESTPGAGSTFHVTLPDATPRARLPARPSEADPGPLDPLAPPVPPPGDSLQ